MNLRTIIKRNLHEAVGVPVGVNDAAQKIFQDMLVYLAQLPKKYKKVRDINDVEFILKGPYIFSNHIINNIKFKFNIEDGEKIDLLGAGVITSSYIQGPNIIKNNNDFIKLTILIRCNHNELILTLLTYLFINRRIMIPTLAHELKHDYDKLKKPSNSIKSIIDYDVSAKPLVAVSTLNLVIFGNYYFHAIENSVRPTEVYSELIELGTTKRNFAQKLRETEFIVTLNFFKNLSYEKLIKSTKKELADITKNLTGVDDIFTDYNVQFFLKNVRELLISRHIILANEFLTPRRRFWDIFSLFSRMSNDSLRFLRKYINSISQNKRYLEGDFEYEKSSKLNEEFFTKRINKIVYLANITYKRIAKIYSILPDDDTQILKNPQSNLNEYNIKNNRFFMLNEMKKIGIDKLPYAYSSLKKFIDPETMNVHYNKHYKTYVEKLNLALSEYKDEDYSLEEIVSSIKKFNDDVRNNAGGAFNHALFWKMLSPTEKKPGNIISKAIDKDFGGIGNLKKEFNSTAKSKFGSGWVWLIINDDKKLKIVTTSNQDNPIMNIGDEYGYPLLGLDLWEHAYYLKYKNRRDMYIKNFWKVINWEFVEKMYLLKTGQKIDESYFKKTYTRGRQKRILIY